LNKPIALTLLIFLLAACSAVPTLTDSKAIMNTPIATRTDIPTPDQVEVWLTLGDASKKLSQEPSLTFVPAPTPDSPVIKIDSETRYQQFEGAGASLTESSAFLIMSILDSHTRDILMHNLFTRKGQGIGLSYLRQTMGASDFALSDYTYDDQPSGHSDPDLSDFSIDRDRKYVIPALRMALELNPQLHIMGSPWSPPAWMKKNAQLHGSELLPEYYQAFADYHVKFVQAYASEEIHIDAITIQNEPNYATSGYPSMFMPASAQQTFVRDYLGPAFKKAGLETRILIFDHNWDIVDYPIEVLSDPAAAAYVDGVAFHCYGGDVSAQAQFHERFPQVGIWFTECSGGQWAQGFGSNLSWMTRNLVIDNYRYWGKSTILWNLALDENAGPQNGGCNNCRGVVTINQNNGEITYNEEFYILGHVTKFVDPGAYRIDSGPSDYRLPRQVAFLNPDGSLVLIVQADSPVDFTVTWQGKTFSYQLPSAGVVTFKWNIMH